MQTGKLEGLGKRAGMGDTDDGGIRFNTVFQRVWDLSLKFEQRSDLLRAPWVGGGELWEPDAEGVVWRGGC